jgi:hypothetical protein
MRSTTEARGTPPLRVGNDVGVDVGNDVGVNDLGHRGTGPAPAGLRSLPAKQHAPKARPSPATDRGRQGVSRAGRQARMAAPWGPARRRGAGHSPLTAGHRALPAPRVFRRAWWPACRGETSHGCGCQPVTRRTAPQAGLWRRSPFRGVSGRCRRPCRRCRPGRSPGCPGAQTARRWDSARRG